MRKKIKALIAVTAALSGRSLAPPSAERVVNVSLERLRRRQTLDDFTARPALRSFTTPTTPTNSRYATARRRDRL